MATKKDKVPDNVSVELASPTCYLDEFSEYGSVHRNVNPDCVFCKIVNGSEPSFKIWEDEEHVAFLSLTPNTEGFTVVATKKHFSSYAFDQNDDVLARLVIATKRVARVLDDYFENVGCTGMIFEGYGVDHLHSKLIPMHGTGNTSTFKKINGSKNQYFKTYAGYISSHECHHQSHDALDILAKNIVRHQRQNTKKK